MILVTLTQSELNESPIGTSLLKKGPFIHASTIDLFDRILHKFIGRGDLFLIGIDESKLESPCQYEDKNNNQLFYPHIYGPINPSAILWQIPLVIKDNQIVWPIGVAPHFEE
ncbi:DUF952 domain-containing protein [Acholeplasma vituli]|uniref:DUF952 domain-containing protein n=1 Tax=Paracholeplasma vituli TaxID=69473 RepID=A0ABT2Q0V0_9MOLU|nr:DUF952 domain-containing protein [Paracholeplasma vituli]MCU0105533.1 DUF952 domain-containing protein [Paracholeplasma vituli]